MMSQNIIGQVSMWNPKYNTNEHYSQKILNTENQLMVNKELRINQGWD